MTSITAAWRRLALSVSIRQIPLQPDRSCTQRARTRLRGWLAVSLVSCPNGAFDHPLGTHVDHRAHGRSGMGGRLPKVVERLLNVSATSESQASDYEDNEATAERAIATIRIIAGALDGVANAGAYQSLKPSTTQRVFLLAYGWFAFIVRTGELIALGHENGLRHECAGSARTVQQYTLALQWLTEGGDLAYDAVEADEQRHAYDLMKELRDTGWPVPDGFTMQVSTKPAKSGALEEQISNYKAMCVLYKGGDQLYVPFRLESSYAHPSFVGAQAYIDFEKLELSLTAIADTYAYLIETARCLIQAGLAFATLLTDSVISSEVANAQETLGQEFRLWERLS